MVYRTALEKIPSIVLNNKSALSDVQLQLNNGLTMATNKKVITDRIQRYAGITIYFLSIEKKE